MWIHSLGGARPSTLQLLWCHDPWVCQHEEICRPNKQQLSNRLTDKQSSLPADVAWVGRSRGHVGGRRPKQTAASPSERGVAGRAGRGAGIELFIDMGNSPVADGGDYVVSRKWWRFRGNEDCRTVQGRLRHDVLIIICMEKVNLLGWVELWIRFSIWKRLIRSLDRCRRCDWERHF